MVKIICHKLFAIALSLLVLFSTFSFTVEKHFCGDTLMDVAVFTDAKGCCPDEKQEITKVPCCKDVLDIIEGQDDLVIKTFDDLEFSKQQFFKAFIYTALTLHENISKQIIPHKDYEPPLIIYDIQLLHDTFLI